MLVHWDAEFDTEQYEILHRAFSLAWQRLSTERNLLSGLDGQGPEILAATLMQMLRDGKNDADALAANAVSLLRQRAQIQQSARRLTVTRHGEAA